MPGLTAKGVVKNQEELSSCLAQIVYGVHSYLKVPIIENSVCQEMFAAAGHTKKILPSFLCAGYANGQKDSKFSAIHRMRVFHCINTLTSYFYLFPFVLQAVK